MKSYRLPYLAVMLPLLLLSCEQAETDEYLIKYNEAPPLTVTISDVPSSEFSPDTVLYIKFYENFSSKSVQGNAPVGADGRAVINLHLPTGVPYKVVGPGKTILYILRDNKTKEELFRTEREIELKTHATNISLSFTADFVRSSNP
jgi:hypothetical protein